MEVGQLVVGRHQMLGQQTGGGGCSGIEMLMEGKVRGPELRLHRARMTRKSMWRQGNTERKLWQS